MKKPDLSVIFAVYPGREDIALSLIELDRYLSEHPISYEVLVPISSEAGEIYEKIRTLSTHVPHLYPFELESESDEASVTKKGISLARGAWSLVITEDNETPLREVNKIIRGIFDTKESKRTELFFDAHTGSGAYGKTPKNTHRFIAFKGEKKETYSSLATHERKGITKSLENRTPVPVIGV